MELPTIQTADTLAQLANRLALRPTASTRHMEFYERANGIFTMLSDLELLARADGCVAAAWAIEAITELAHEHFAIEAECRRNNGPHVNTGAHALAGRILTIIERE